MTIRIAEGPRSAFCPLWQRFYGYNDHFNPHYKAVLPHLRPSDDPLDPPDGSSGPSDTLSEAYDDLLSSSCRSPLFLSIDRNHSLRIEPMALWL